MWLTETSLCAPVSLTHFLSVCSVTAPLTSRLCVDSGHNDYSASPRLLHSDVTMIWDWRSLPLLELFSLAQLSHFETKVGSYVPAVHSESLYSVCSLKPVDNLTTSRLYEIRWESKGSSWILHSVKCYYLCFYTIPTHAHIWQGIECKYLCIA